MTAVTAAESSDRTRGWRGSPPPPGVAGPGRVGAAVEDEDESLLGAGVVLEDDESPDDFSEVLGASVELLPARESVR